LREGRLGRQVYRWAPIGIGGVVAVAAAALTDPNLIVSVGAAGVGLTIQGLQAHRDKPASITYKAQTQANLIELDRDVGRNRRWLGRVFS
jgi:hypothetical protein